MSKNVKVADLQPGMKVAEHVVGKKGDVKVRKGEILSQMHVEKMKKWKGLDDANPRGICIESTPLKTATLMPEIVDHPEKSPLIERGAKQKLQKSMAVKVAFDKEGNIIQDEPTQTDKTKRRRGRPRKKRA